MAYGTQASLEHATSHIERAAAHLEPSGSESTDPQVMLRELLSAAAYLRDAVRYLSEGTP